MVENGDEAIQVVRVLSFYPWCVCPVWSLFTSNPTKETQNNTLTTDYAADDA
jgi:hypothetical protein